MKKNHESTASLISDAINSGYDSVSYEGDILYLHKMAAFADNADAILGVNLSTGSAVRVRYMSDSRTESDAKKAIREAFAENELKEVKV